MGRRKKKGDSPVKTVFLILVAAVVMVTAIYVVVTIFGKIQSDYRKFEKTTESESQTETIELTEEDTKGWNSTENGWKYLIDPEKKQYAQDQWLEIDGFLYRFDEEGIMLTGEWNYEGQIYTFHDTKGYLKDIQVDLTYVPESTGENLNSLVRTNAFWCYLDEEDEGPFRTILYKRTVENKVLPLGDADQPEKTTVNSMRTEGDYVYYLPKVSEGRMAQLSEEEKELCNTLVRMIPGQKTKEIIAENVGGYFFLNGTIYYSQNGKIYGTTSGYETAVGKSRYSVTIDGDDCYLIDAAGNPPSSAGGNTITIEDRVYKFEKDGKILSVTPAKTAKKGVQSSCIVDNYIYYSAYVDKPSKGEWYSQIFRTRLDGSEKTEISEKFPGSIETMYYFEEEGEIYGEYHPASWKQAYGTVVIIRNDGTILKLSDENVRTGKYTAGNDMLKLVMAKDGEVFCLWQDCEWSSTKGITAVLWSKAVKLSAYQTSSVIETEEPEEEETDPSEPEGLENPDEVIIPIETKEEKNVQKEPGGNGILKPGTTVNETTPTTAAETEAPASPITPAPTVSPSAGTTEEVTIIPLG